MKKALKVLLLATPIALLFYSPLSLVPAVDAKTLLIRGILAIVSVLFLILFFQDAPFRTEMMAKLKLAWREPLGKTLGASFGVLLLSTIFAYNKFNAFYGTGSRGEGFVGLVFYYFLALFAALLFEKKDWLTYWKLTAAAGAIVFLKEMADWFGGAYRPGSLMDNPIFLAGYFLIVIYAGLSLFVEGRDTKKKQLVWIGLGAVGMAVFGMLVTQSRGALLGAVVGMLAALGYLALRGGAKGESGKDPVKKLATIVLVTMLAFGGLFAATRHAAVWAHIPGFSRVAQFSSGDLTTQSRIENARLTIRAVSPSISNFKNTLIGWGWDNYVFAWQTHYDPKIYLYDRAIFDRAHNKLLDVLMMNGFLGLIAYLALWVCIVRIGIRIGKRSSLEGAAILFFGVAFFIQNLFVFDTVISYVPFFTLLGYMLFESRKTYA